MSSPVSLRPLLMVALSPSNLQSISLLRQELNKKKRKRWPEKLLKWSKSLQSKKKTKESRLKDNRKRKLTNVLLNKQRKTLRRRLPVRLRIKDFSMRRQI